MLFYAKSTGGFYDSLISVAIPDDAIEISQEHHQALMEAQSQGKVIVCGPDGLPMASDPPSPTADEIRTMRVADVQAFMDEKARQLSYDDIRTAVTYADEPAVPRFQAEGKAFRAWRSLVWEACYAILNDVMAGTRTVPTTEELIAALPALELPAPT